MTRRGVGSGGSLVNFTRLWLTALLSFSMIMTGVGFLFLPSVFADIPPNFRARAISVDDELNFERDMGGVTYNWDTDFIYTTAEQNLGSIYAPYLDACWFSTPITAETLTSNDINKAGTCFPIKKIQATETALTVIPADDVSYAGNKQVDLTYPIQPGQNASDVAWQHVVLRYANPDLYTRFTYTTDSGNPANIRLSGEGAHKISDRPVTYTQLVPKKDSSGGSFFTAVVTVLCDRWCNPQVRKDTGDTSFVSAALSDGSSVPTVNNDISTPRFTVQRFIIRGNGPAKIRLSYEGKNNLTLGASIATAPNNFAIGGNEFNPPKWDRGGNPPYVRKIFTGTGYGSHAPEGTGTASAGTSQNPNGCSINKGGDCTGDWWKNSTPPGSSNSVNGKQVYYVDGTRQDNCVFRLGRYCGNDANNASASRNRHVDLGAAGGCSREAYNCLTPANARPLKLAGWDDPTTPSREYKIWFDHVQNGNAEKESYNHILSELWVNGELVQVPQYFPCVPTPSGNHSKYRVCQNIATQYNTIGYTQRRSGDYGNREDLSAFINDGVYKNPRKKWLGMSDSDDSVNTPFLLDHTFQKGPNAGTRVKVRVVNVRLAGEYKGMIDDMSGDIDYTGYCDPYETIRRIPQNTVNPPIADRFCGWAYDGGAKGILFSTRYEVTISSPQQVHTVVSAGYYNTANDRFVATGITGVYSTSENEPNNIQIWSRSTASKTETNNDPRSWEKLCEGGEGASGVESCSYSYRRQLYSQSRQATVRFNVRNGFAPPQGQGLRIRATNDTVGSEVRTEIIPRPNAVTDDPNSRFVYGWVEATSNRSYSAPIDSIGLSFGPDSRTLGMSSVTNIMTNVQPKSFRIKFLKEGAQEPAPGLNTLTFMNVVDNATFIVPRPETSVGEHQFLHWKLMWCAPSSQSGTCDVVEAAKHRANSDNNEASGSDIILKPGEVFNINDIYRLTDPKAGSNYNQTHDHLALVAVTGEPTNVPLIYSTVRKLDQPAEVHDRVNMFSGVPGLTATMKLSEWNKHTGDISKYDTTYSYVEAKSVRTTTLMNEHDALYLLFTSPNSKAQLTLIRAIENIPNDPLGSDNTASSISLEARDSSGTQVANPNVDGDRKTYEEVDPGTYSLVSSTTNKVLAPTGTGWVCVDTSVTPASSVSSSGGNLNVEAGQNIECRITYSTSNITAFAKVEGENGVSRDDLGLSFVAVDENGNEVSSVPRDQHYFSQSPYFSAALAVNQDTPDSSGSNLMRVRPGTSYHIQPTGALGGYRYSIQKLKPGLAVTAENIRNDANWVDMDLVSGKASEVNAPATSFLAYRLVLKPAPMVPLPFTGGSPADLFIGLGIAVIVGAGLILIYRHRRSRRERADLMRT